MKNIQEQYNRIYKKYPTNEACLKLLEMVRWKDAPTCPYCTLKKAYTHKEKHKVRWQCANCKRSFSVTVGTIFHNSHVELHYWFFLINVMFFVDSNLSACEAARHLQLRRPTVWSMMNRIRKSMLDDKLLSNLAAKLQL